MFLSVIIPVYNAEKYLERCVRSVLKQGLSNTDYEILLINDGSTDNSLCICEKLQKENPLVIHIFNRKNQGVGLTRQFGIEQAKGDYIAFCDADDYLVPDGYRYIKDNFMQDSDIDILSFFSKTILEEECDLDQEPSIQGEIVYDGNGLDYYCFKHHPFVWNHFYRRSYIINANIKFQSFSIGEDGLFNLQLAMTNPRMRVVSSCVYRYVHHSTSVMHNRNPLFLRKAINDYVQFLSLVKKYEKDLGDKNLGLSKGLNLFINRKMIPFLTRVLSSDYNLKDFTNLREMLILNNILPVVILSRKDFFVNLFFKTYIFFPIYKFLYNKIFMIYISKMNRRK